MNLRQNWRHRGWRVAALGGAALALVVAASDAGSGGQAAEVDPLVKASAYADKTVWSYHAKEPLPWKMFRPRDYGTAKVKFRADGVRAVGRVPAPGVHPRIFFSPEDLPAMRKRIKEDRAAAEAWKNILAWTHALKLDYDETAAYAQPDWAKGAFQVHGRFADLHRIGGYGAKREDYYSILARGGKPRTYEKTPAEFFKPAATEAFRCLIEEDAQGARTLAAATITAVKLEQERRAKEDKPVAPGNPPRPSTSRSAACSLGFIYDFIHPWLTKEQRDYLREELVLLSAWSDNYGTFNHAEASRSNWATFSYWVFDLMAIEGEPGFNDLKFLGLYRGWRNFYTYSFFESGAAFEGEGKLLFGLDAAVAFDRVGHKYGLEPLTRHPLPRAYYSKFSALAMLPTRDKFAVFDILGGMGGGFTTPQDLVVAKFLYQNDRGIDFVYRALVGDDYRNLPSALHYHWHNAITSAVFATAYDPEITPEGLRLPLTFFCGQRALMMTRSSWERDATMLTMHVRGASGGHPYRDRNGIMLAGEGRTWVTIPNKDIGGWACNTVVIDGAEQNATTPARVVDHCDTPDATFLTGDAKYCWDWVWSQASKDKDGGEITRDDVAGDRVDTGAGWSLVEQSFNDFAWTKGERPVDGQSLRWNASWIGVDGVLAPVIRQPNLPVLRSFRTAGLVRGSRPYVLVVDDVQRDAMPALYEWNLTLAEDLVEADAVKAGGREGDILLAGKGTMDEGGLPKAGEPVLLLRVLDVQGTWLPHFLGKREGCNLLSLRVRSGAPGFKVLMHAFRAGEPFPITERSTSAGEWKVRFPGQEDVIRFGESAVGRTEVTVERGGKVIVSLRRPVVPLDDPAAAGLSDGLRQMPRQLEEMRRENFDRWKTPGLVAGWDFTRQENGVYPPVAGSVAAAKGFPVKGTVMGDTGSCGGAVRIDKGGMTAPLDFADELTDQFTLSFWVKTTSNPKMGTVADFGGHRAISFDILQGGLRLNACGSWKAAAMPTSMLAAWTHFAVTHDGSRLKVYRNGIALVEIACKGSRMEWGKVMRFGGDNGYGDAGCEIGGVMFHRGCLDPAVIGKLHLAGKTGNWSAERAETRSDR